MVVEDEMKLIILMLLASKAVSSLMVARAKIKLIVLMLWLDRM